MEHILQFGISIDDEHIKANIEAAAIDKLADEFSKEVKKTIFKTSYYGYVTNEPSEWITDRFNEFLENYKDEIFNKAATILADKLSRTKAYKEVVGKVASEQ